MRFNYDSLNDRLVINITNKCNEICPFCFLDAGPTNDNILSLDAIKNIFHTTLITTEKIEVQLTGGEPTLHPDILAITEWFAAQPNVCAIMIDTNGQLLDKSINDLFNIAMKIQVPIFIKISVNYWLVEKYPDHIERIKTWVQKYHNNDRFEIVLSIRHRTPRSLDDFFMTQLWQTPFENVTKICNPLYYIGRAKKLKLGNVCVSNEMQTRSANPIVFASDGTCFGADYKRRNAYEYTLSKQ